jgi:hypothetical protein
MHLPPAIPKRSQIAWTWADGRQGGRAIYDDTTSAKTVFLLLPAVDPVRLGDVLAAYGPPSHVVAGAGHGPDIGSPVLYWFAIVYASRGVSLAWSGGQSRPTIEATLLLERVTFFAPIQTPAAFRAQFGFDPTDPTRVGPWVGIQPFATYCRAAPGDPSCTKP